nr:hypothetical protein [Pseudomonas aeruginosa]
MQSFQAAYAAAAQLWATGLLIFFLQTAYAAATFLCHPPNPMQFLQTTCAAATSDRPVE